MNARTVIQANGKPRRVILRQPPHFRTGSDALPVVDRLAADAKTAMAHARDDRGINSKSNGARPRAC